MKTNFVPDFNIFTLLFLPVHVLFLYIHTKCPTYFLYLSHFSYQFFLLILYRTVYLLKCLNRRRKKKGRKFEMVLERLSRADANKLEKFL